MFRMDQLLAGLALAGLAVGCGGGGVKEQTIEIKKSDAMLQVKATLDNYARGQPIASEVTSFDYMVEEVRKVDPAKADILRAGLDDIKTTKGSPAAKARALLKKLGLDEPKGTKP
jgi:hypothetical protein